MTLAPPHRSEISGGRERVLQSAPRDRELQRARANESASGFKRQLQPVPTVRRQRGGGGGGFENYRSLIMSRS